MGKKPAFELIREEDGFGLPKLTPEKGSQFGWGQNWQGGLNDNYVTDFSDWEARDMHEMLTKDYKGRQIENVLTLPLSSSAWTIQPAEGDAGEAEWLKKYWDADSYAGGCRTTLDQIISLMTSAFYFKRAYFEKVWIKGTGDFEGKLIYGDVAWRPQTTCKIMRHPRTGRFVGFEQEPYYVGTTIRHPEKWPIKIKPDNAFVYTHGTRRDPIMGSSDLEVAFWAWKTKQKILMLWFQFLQSVSLPRTVVQAQDQTTANQIAQQIARLKSSGVLPISAPGGADSVSITPLDVSGKGAEQFLEAIKWLDSAATNSVLAGFLDLTGQATDGAGSYALSKDASDFFLQSLEAKAREMEDQVRAQLFAPLIHHNFGPQAKVPTLRFEPLNDIDKAVAVDLLKQAMAAPPGGPIPTDFIAGLAGQVATSLGLDSEEARNSFKKAFDEAAAEAKAEALALPGGASPVGQHVAGLSGAASAAAQALKAGMTKKEAKREGKKVAKAHERDSKEAKVGEKREGAKQQLRTSHAAKALKAKTGGAVSLSNEDVDLAGYDPAQPRTAGGTWGGGGEKEEKGKTGPGKEKMSVERMLALVQRRAALQREAKHLRELIQAQNIGVKRGQAGVKKGQSGKQVSAVDQGKKAAWAAAKAEAEGKGKSSGGEYAGKKGLSEQVKVLEQTVTRLRAQYSEGQKIKAAKRKLKAKGKK